METIEFNDGTLILFSYGTPVAGFIPSLGYVRTTEWFSSTTSKHINKWLKEIDKHATAVPQAVFEDRLAVM